MFGIVFEFLDRGLGRSGKGLGLGRWRRRCVGRAGFWFSGFFAVAEGVEGDYGVAAAFGFGIRPGRLGGG